MWRILAGVMVVAWSLAGCGDLANTGPAEQPKGQDANSVPGMGGVSGTSMPGSDGSSTTGSLGTGGTQDGNTQNGNSAQSAGSAQNAALACPGDANDAYAAARIACVQTINNYRATLGLPALARWCGEAVCIDDQTGSDSANQQAHSAFGACKESAQNECPGWPTPVQGSLTKCLGQMWNEGPGGDFSTHGHYINMTSSKYTKVECGVSVSGDKFWGAMDFK